MLSPVRIPTMIPNANITSLSPQLRDVPSFPFQTTISNPITSPSFPFQTTISNPITSPSWPNLTGKQQQQFVPNNPMQLAASERRESLIPRILVQSIPKNSSIEGSWEYDPNEIITISSPNISSQVNNDNQTMQVINSVPHLQNLPAFVYQRNNETGQLTRYLVMEEDKSYDTDPNYGISQEWLLFQRQGDQFNRISEWNEYPEITEAEEFNVLGVTTLNEGRVWMGPPRATPTYHSPYYDEYKRYIEYGQTQIEEEDES